MGEEARPDIARGYVGFWMRFSAGLIDLFVILIPALIAGFFLPVIGGIVVYWLYSALLHSSRHRATVGRMALGIVMTDEQGERVSFGKASGQYFAQIISTLILCFGYFMIGWTKRKQGLHDMMAGTLTYYRVQR